MKQLKLIKENVIDTDDMQRSNDCIIGVHEWKKKTKQNKQMKKHRNMSDS